MDQNISLYILNEHNQLITEQDIKDIFKEYNINYTVNNIDVFRMAMTHTSYVHKDDEYWKTHRSKNTNKDLVPISDPAIAIPLQSKSFEELELLGDSVIHCVLAYYFCKRFKDTGEGFITKLRSKIENGDTLAHFCKVIKLNKFILISRYIEKNGGRNDNTRILEDAFEAFIGAIFLDTSSSNVCNFENCKNFIINLIEQEVDLGELLYTETNFKDKLLQYFHKMKYCDPIYTNLSVSGPEHSKIFTVSVSLKTHIGAMIEICGMGTGASKKKGEQEAAKKALIKFNQYKEDSRNTEGGSATESNDYSD